MSIYDFTEMFHDAHSSKTNKQTRLNEGVTIIRHTQFHLMLIANCYFFRQVR